MKTYEELLESKRHRIVESGFDVNETHPSLFHFQDYVVRKALKAGRYSLFEDCGLGKTIQQLVWGQKVVEHTNKPVLALAPLAVSGQTIKEGEKFGIEVVKAGTDLRKAIHITNYEQLDNIDPNDYSGLILDESSILKNFEGSLRNKIIDGFANHRYKLACTATPSPNDPMELGNHSEFMNAMSRLEMLSMYFVHDGGETAKWRLKGHSNKVFWQFINTFSKMLSKPSDLGFSDEGYELPPIHYIEKKIITNKRNNGQLFNDVAISATNFNAELRLTIKERMQAVADVVGNSNETFIIWVNQNEEAKVLKSMLPGCVEVSGSDSPDYKEEMLLGFANNNFRVLLTKLKIAQFGLNYQNCHNQYFAAPDFSFEKQYQGIRRSYRFGQQHQVNIYMNSTDTMLNVAAALERKSKQFQEMQRQMTLAINGDYRTEKMAHAFKKMQLPKFLYAS